MEGCHGPTPQKRPQFHPTWEAVCYLSEGLRDAAGLRMGTLERYSRLALFRMASDLCMWSLLWTQAATL